MKDHTEVCLTLCTLSPPVIYGSHMQNILTLFKYLQESHPIYHLSMVQNVII